MNHHKAIGRREFLTACSAAAALGSAGSLRQSLALAAELNGGHPLAPKPAHHAAKAERMIFIFLTGGFSHVDTFDPKPKLSADHGKTVGAESLRDVTKQPLLASPFKFSPAGQSGIPISELFPRLATVADELCVIRSLHTDIVEHFQATLAMHTGSATIPLPSIGAWLSYGLGTFNANLPSYVVLAEHTPYAGRKCGTTIFCRRTTRACGSCRGTSRSRIWLRRPARFAWPSWSG